MAETGCQNAFKDVCNEHLCSPYKTPDIPKLVDGEFPESASKIIRDADIVGI
jgi:hypothetical protein